MKNFNKAHYVERPIIAISANIIDENSALHFAYSEAVVAAGGVPVIVSANCTREAIHSLVGSVDGVLFSGGADIDAVHFGEENLEGLTEVDALRDEAEFMLLRAAMDRGVPILGICRGAQLLNVAFGGSLYQDLPSQYSGELLSHSVLDNRHLPCHGVEVVEGSMLHKIIGKSEVEVNSRHHQAIKDIAPIFKVVARSSDGVVEAIEAYPVHKIIAVQWHPENLATRGESREMQRLFSFLVSEAQLYRRAKRIHTLSPIVDSHCDTPMLYSEGGFNFGERDSRAQVDVVKMAEGLLDATVTVAYIPQRTPKGEATSMAFNLLKRFREDLEKLSDRVVIASSTSEVLRAKRSGLRAVMLGVENGYAIGDNLENIDKLKAQGVVYITLCHNGSNDICDSAIGEQLHSGVSDFGEEVIARMNSLGVTVDVSHSSEKSTFDALRLSTQPIIASHSSCKALYDHPRNLSDEAIMAIARSGGVVQVCAYGGFLSSGDATVLDVVNHIEHIVGLTGYHNVGVGSDFDGGGGVEGFSGVNDFLNITVELLRRGHSEENIAKIMGENILRVL